MGLLRKLLFPFSLIYDLVAQSRNFLFDKQIFKSATYDIPIIAVGNLSVGGTGKTPMIQYLIELLSKQHRIATLSRGYGRNTKGFILATEKESAKSIGDEPFQIFEKFPIIQVAVDADRQNGIQNLLAQKNPPEIILLDDAFQHRKVKAGFYILLTAFDKLFSDDLILPAGNLRESRAGARRADVVVVTKCPPGISSAKMSEIENKLGLEPSQKLYFTTIDYSDNLCGKDENFIQEFFMEKPKVLVAGIADPTLFFNQFENVIDKLIFPDHHSFTEKDILKIKKIANGNMIITTEKDYVRLKDFGLEHIYYLPIKTRFIERGKEFEKIIKDYVGKSTRNS